MPNLVDAIPLCLCGAWAPPIQRLRLLERTSCGQRPDDHRGQMESPASFLDSGESLGSESPEGWRRAPKLLCKPNARGQSIAEGNKLDGTPIGKRTLTRPSRRHFARKAYGPWMESPRISQGPGKARNHGAPHTPGTRLMSQNLKPALV